MLYAFSDASLANTRDCFGIGAVILDSDGVDVAVCAAAVACPPWCTSTLAERHAALEVLRFAARFGEPLVLHVDDESIVHVAAGRVLRASDEMAAAAHRTYEGALQAELRRGVTVQWVPRANNSAANALARWALTDRAPPAIPGALVPVRGEWRQRWPEDRRASAA